MINIEYLEKVALSKAVVRRAFNEKIRRLNALRSGQAPSGTPFGSLAHQVHYDGIKSLEGYGSKNPYVFDAKQNIARPTDIVAYNTFQKKQKKLGRGLRNYITNGVLIDTNKQSYGLIPEEKRKIADDLIQKSDNKYINIKEFKKDKDTVLRGIEATTKNYWNDPRDYVPFSQITLHDLRDGGLDNMNFMVRKDALSFNDKGQAITSNGNSMFGSSQPFTNTLYRPENKYWIHAQYKDKDLREQSLHRYPEDTIPEVKKKYSPPMKSLADPINTDYRTFPEVVTKPEVSRILDQYALASYLKKHPDIHTALKNRVSPVNYKDHTEYLLEKAYKRYLGEKIPGQAWGDIEA